MSNMHTHLNAERLADLAKDPAEHPRRAHPVQNADPVLRTLSAAEAAFNRYAAHHLRQASQPGEDKHRRIQQAGENANLAQAMREGILAHYAKSTECGDVLRQAIVAAADRHAIYHTLRPMVSVLTEVLEAERRAGWTEGAPAQPDPERQPLTDEQWLKRFTRHSGQRLKPGARRDELLSLIRWVERNVAGTKGGAA